MSKFETLLVESPAAGVLLLTLNRPHVLNAVNTQMSGELLKFFTDLETARDVQAVVMTGAGDRAYCVGADLKERNGMSNDAWRDQHAMHRRGHRQHMACPIPMIAAVNGLALGGGGEQVLSCDFIYAAEDAEFGFPEIKRGIMPGMGATQRLARVIGEPRAKELILTGDTFSAAEAHAWGMVNKLVPRQDVVTEAIAAAARIAANAPLAIRAAKQVIHAGLQTDLASGLMIEVLAHQRLSISDDRHEGVAAFNEKRPPVWRGS
jgi:enoyl-CoA hydratase